MKKIFFALCLISIFALSSCTADIDAELLNDGTVKLAFSGSFGQGLKSMIGAATEGEAFFDTKEIIYELSKSGFTDVKANTDGKTQISISMKDAKKTSYLFTSGILSVKAQKEKKSALLYAKLSPANLVNFYKSSDEQLVLLMDLLLAPVFNEEDIPEQEYIETIGAFYGQTAANEIAASNVNISIKNPDGSIKKQTIPVVKLLTLSEDLIIQ